MVMLNNQLCECVMVPASSLSFWGFLSPPDVSLLSFPPLSWTNDRLTQLGTKSKRNK